MPLPSGLPNPYTDEDIYALLGQYTQSEPPDPNWDALIVAYDAARFKSLNPARQALFNGYAAAGAKGDTKTQNQLLGAAQASDQPLIDEEIDLQFGGNGPANKSPGTFMAMRRFAYFYMTTPAYAPTGQSSPGNITNTLVPPSPYSG
jgi:hypothetical protein